MIAIVVLTYNRLHLLRACVENVLARTSEDTTEIVIWDNASTDGTAEYLDSLTDRRITVVHNPENVGQNAYSLAFPRTTADYLLELDDDVIDARPGWDRTMLKAFEALPQVGFLQARLADDGHSPGADLFYRINSHLYELKEVNGFRIWQNGPVGGGCTITSRKLHDEVGGFRQHKSLTFWYEDEAYIQDIRKLGYETAILDDVEVFHAGGPYYADIVPEKLEFWAHRDRAQARKDNVKRVLLTIPFVSSLNARHGWFQAPARREE